MPAFKLKPTLKQKQSFTSSYQKLLDVMMMDSRKIREELLKVVNPIIRHYHMNRQLSDYFSFSAQENIRSDLYYQLHTSKQNYDEKVCQYIIESLDEHGFFAYHQEYPFLFEKERVDQALKLIKSFEPEGIACENSIEFIRLQLKNRHEALALRLMDECEEEIIKNDTERILDRLGIDENQLKDCLHTIRSMKLYPCELEKSETVWAQGDVCIEVRADEINITPAMDELPLFDWQNQQLSKEAKAYLKQSNIMLDMINQRNLTLMQIIHALCAIQRGYFINDDPLKPCRLEDVARITGIHISTISRVCKDKYYEYQGNLYPFRTLLASGNYQGKSHKELYHILQDLLENEDKEKPYSDDELVVLLSKQDIQISRRGIAQLRKKWQIPNSYQRKAK